MGLPDRPTWRRLGEAAIRGLDTAADANRLAQPRIPERAREVGDELGDLLAGEPGRDVVGFTQELADPGLVDLLGEVGLA
jgi:hypothetical protein